MNYFDFMIKAADLCIVEANNGLYYIEPHWRIILYSEEMDPENVSDFEINWNSIKEYLELEVKKRNTMNDKKPYILEWLQQIVATNVEPALLEQETEYIKNLTEYMQAKNNKNE